MNVSFSPQPYLLLRVWWEGLQKEMWRSLADAKSREIEAIASTPRQSHQLFEANTIFRLAVTKLFTPF